MNNHNEEPKIRQNHNEIKLMISTIANNFSIELSKLAIKCFRDGVKAGIIAKEQDDQKKIIKP